MKKFIGIFAAIFFASLISASLGYDNPNLPNIKAPSATAFISNGSIINNFYNVTTDASNWSEYPAMSYVDFNDNGITNLGNSTFSGSNYTFTFFGMVHFFFYGTSGMDEVFYWDGGSNTVDFLKKIYSTQSITSQNTVIDSSGLSRDSGPIIIQTNDAESNGATLQFLECNENLGNCNMNNYPLVNIGSSGTDFDDKGNLNMVGANITAENAKFTNLNVTNNLYVYGNATIYGDIYLPNLCAGAILTIDANGKLSASACP